MAFALQVLGGCEHLQLLSITDQCRAGSCSSLRSAVEAAVSGVTWQVQMLRKVMFVSVVCVDAMC